jgi:hypothetical protein
MTSKNSCQLPVVGCQQKQKQILRCARDGQITWRNRVVAI